MQNVQNAAEIQQRVINLVELYRTKVGKESEMAKTLAAEYKSQYDSEIDIAMYLHEQGTNHYSLNIDIPEDHIDTLRTNDQLLGYFYKKVAGKASDSIVLQELLYEKFDKSVFSIEEEAFLIEHFKEMVNYIIQTPNNDLSAIDGSERMDFFLMPTEVLELIKSRVNIPDGSKIYNPFTGFAQLACLYPNCSFLCEESYIPYNKEWNSYCDRSRKEANVIHHKIDEYKLYAWMKIALYANNVELVETDNNTTVGLYDTVMAFVPWIPNAIPEDAYGYSGEAKNEQRIVDKLCDAYHYLPNGGKMILMLPNECLYGNLSVKELWNSMMKDNSFVEIIQLPSIMGKHLNRDFCIVIAEKNRKDNYITFTDARFACIKSSSKVFMGTLDVMAFKNMIRNNGIEENTGLRKSVKTSSSLINPSILIPQIYVVEKPSKVGNPVPLSDLCQLVTKKVRDVNYDLPLDTPMVHATDLSLTFCGSLDVKTLGKANCPNNPPHTGEYAFDKEGHFIDDPFHYIFGKGSVEDKGLKVAEYRQCAFLDGSKPAVLVALTNEGLKTALLEPSGTPVAVETNPSMSNKHFYVFCPKEGIDIQNLLAVLRLPVVCRQLQAFDEFGLYGSNGLFKEIIVPTNKLILYDEMRRLQLEQNVYKTQEEKLIAKKTEYINEVRMRKHDMGQYIFELANIEGLMRYYIENRGTEPDYCSQIESLLDNFKSSIGELSTLLDNLSKEEEFGTPEIFNLDEFLSQLDSRHKADGFKIDYSRDESSIIRYNQKLRNDDLVVLDDYVPEIVNDLDDHVAEDTNDLDEYIPEIVNDLDDYIAEDTNDLDDYQTEDIHVLDDYVANVDAPHDYSYKECVNQSHDFSSNASVDEIDDYVVENAIKNNKNLSKVPLLYIAPNDMQRAVNNIIDNARKHGFTGSETKNNKIEVRLSIDTEQNMFVIDFRNNGEPLPEGMNKMRYGIKGEKAGKTAGSGIGGSYIKKFAEHYGGNYDIFMEDGWTVVRIYLPIK